MRKTFLDFISLHKGEEKKEIVMRDVRDNISFRNANFWILVCAILIASIGLNVNSTAVIIGAMLISPLMGPIVGAGFALATYDFELLKRAMKNLLIATMVSLFVAGLYFFISPFKETQSELLSRTSPNIYDVLIAFLGGVVGVISLTRVDKGNPIPGVAIATALMPPLCTAGYGLAVGNIQYFAGAFYLYTINCFFICISTFFITKYLKYPPVRTVDKKHDRQIHNIITVLVIVMILPSSYLAYDLWKEKEYIQNVERFLDSEFNKKDHAIIFKNIKYHAKPREIELGFLSKNFTPFEIERIHGRLQNYNLSNTVIVFRQDSSNLKQEILNEISQQDDELTRLQNQVTSLQEKLKTYTLADTTFDKEINILFPEIKEYSVGNHRVSTDTSHPKIVFTYSTNAGPLKDGKKLENWLKTRLRNDNILIFHENLPTK